VPIIDADCSIGKVFRAEGSGVTRTRRRPNLFLWKALLAGLAFGLCGCLGPQAVHFTRSRYNEVIQASNNEELLLNLVRLRYLENPGFLPVSGLTAQFEVDAGAIGRGGIDRGGASNYGQGTLSFADRPTITFAPQRSPELTKGLLTQIPLETLYLFSANGSDHARLLRLFVRNLNGIENAGSGGGPSPSSAPEFVEFRHVAEMLSHLQRQRISVLAVENRLVDVPGAVPMKTLTAQDLLKISAAGQGVRPLGENRGYVLTQSRPVRLLRVHPEAVSSPELVELTSALRLKPYQETYEVEEVVEGQLRSSDFAAERTKITVTTRSVLEVMYLLSKAVSVPDEHACAGLVAETRNSDGSPFNWDDVLGDLFHVQVSKHKPKTAFLTVPYRGYWYYVDDADTSSKITLGMFTDLFRLQRLGAAEGQPLLTLPVGR
jgi:hypothetical protein